MAADPGARTEFGGAALDHAPGVDLVHGFCGERAGAADGGAEEGGLAALANAGSLDIRGVIAESSRKSTLSRIEER